MMKPYITVDNCLAYGHEYSRMKHEDYWTEGSVVRKKYFLDQQKRNWGEYFREKEQKKE